MWKGKKIVLCILEALPVPRKMPLNLGIKSLELSPTYRALSCLWQDNIIRRTHVVAGLNLKLLSQMVA